MNSLNIEAHNSAVHN